jgi:hypothetical protein
VLATLWPRQAAKKSEREWQRKKMRLKQTHELILEKVRERKKEIRSGSFLTI